MVNGFGNASMDFNGEFKKRRPNNEEFESVIDKYLVASSVNCRTSIFYFRIFSDFPVDL